MHVTVQDVSVIVSGAELCKRMSLCVGSGEIVGIVGPNGSGKTTLRRTIYRAIKPTSGHIVVGDEDVWAMTARKAATLTSAVVQEPKSDFSFRVEEVVMMGRIPHKAPFAGDSLEDLSLVDAALERVGLLPDRRRQFATLSGGEKQRAMIARAIVQRAHLLVLDEPTNHLDIRYQLEILHLVRELGLTTIMAIHDVNLAAEFCDRVALVQSGYVVAMGTPDEVMTPQCIGEMFGVSVRQIHDEGGTTLFRFTRKTS